MAMASDDDGVASRGRSLVPALALLLALFGLLATDATAVDRGVLRAALGRDLDRIAELGSLYPAGVRGGAESTSLPVTVTQEGGPLWVTQEAEAAITDDPVFTAGDPHLLKVEVVAYARTYGVRGQLWRQGWSLRAPEPLWVSPAPWIVVFSALAGAGVAGLRRRLGGGWLLQGLLAQGLLLALPWPATFVRPSLEQSWREGPLGHAVVELARRLPDVSVAVGAGVITLCALLMLFDHRRSPGRGGGLVLDGLLGVLGAALWLEASLRAGLGPWLGQPAGVVAVAGLLGLWAWTWRRRRPVVLDPQEPPA
ncbi:MAG: hypothetical protein KDK70_29820 [Myxococcales bacterium]|nr:hypothetical protein [Myxococcales bacterium]